MDDPWRDLARAARWLLRLERETAPDLVHVNGYALAAAGFRAPVVVGAHSCVFSWWRAVHGEDPPPAWQRYRRVVTAGLAAADCVVAPTDWMLRQLERHYGFSGPARVIPNGLDPARFVAARKERFVFAAGRLWDAGKNLAALDRAAGEVPWAIVVAGDATRPDGGGACLPGLGLLGPLPPARVAAWLARAAIYALPARYEPFGLSVLEAAMSGCALVLGDIDSLREVWDEDALFVPPDDRAALVAAIRRLIADPHLRRRLGARAAWRANRYTSRRMAEAHLALYHGLASPNPRRRRCVS